MGRAIILPTPALTKEERSIEQVTEARWESPEQTASALLRTWISPGISITDVIYACSGAGQDSSGPFLAIFPDPQPRDNFPFLETPPLADYFLCSTIPSCLDHCISLLTGLSYSSQALLLPSVYSVN